ncbi:hypothetical protein QE152_g3492 [Popillia japonica]|uniref:Uncharacterized protein n=1 Tax=Popillia japonica TaxID=7064 RepID=A0AAW1N427_POPJA
MGPEGRKILHKIINMASIKGKIPRVWTVVAILPVDKKGNRRRCENFRPRVWTVVAILPVDKKGNRRRCENFRPISILSVALKIYETILERRTRQIVEPTFEDNQTTSMASDQTEVLWLILFA